MKFFLKGDINKSSEKKGNIFLPNETMNSFYQYEIKHDTKYVLG